MKIEVFSRFTIRGKRWFFRFVAGNGEIVAHSEGYANKTDAEATAKLVQNGFVGVEITYV